MSTVSRIHGRGFRVQRDPKRWVAWGLKSSGAGELEGKAGKLDSGRTVAAREDNRTVKKDNWKKQADRWSHFGELSGGWADRQSCYRAQAGSFWHGP